MLQLFIGRATSGKSAAIIDEMSARRQVRQVLIVPEQFSHAAERRLCTQCGNGVSLWGEVLSFTRLANRVFATAGGLATPTLDQGGRLLMMHKAVSEMSQGLTVYRRPSQKAPFLSNLLATLDECKSYCLTPEQLTHAGELLGGREGDKLHDLGLIFNAYNTLCSATAADPRDRLTRLAEALKDYHWGAGMDIYVDGFTDFTPQELLVLSALMTQASCLTVALTCDHLEEDEGGYGIFSPARRTAAQLERMAKGNHVAVMCKTHVATQSQRNAALIHLEQQLFSPTITPWQGASPPVVLYCSDDPRSEVEWVAAQVLALVRQGYRYREIGVTSRTFDGYRDLVDSIFPWYGIPVFLAQTSDILEKPILTLITAALDTVAGGYEYDDLFRYLKTGLTNLTDQERDRLENYALTWDVRGGSWTGTAPWGMHPGGYGKEMTPAVEEELALLNRLRQQAIAPLEALRKNSQRTGRGFAMALYRFMEDIALPQRLTQRGQALREAGALNLAEEYAQLWGILRGALEQCAQLLGDAPLRLEEFAKLFTLLLSQYDVGTIPVSLDRITAGECTRIGFGGCKVLFFMGCTDSSIPQCTPPPGLLTDGDRALLADLGLRAGPGVEEKLHREMTIVYETCVLPQERLVVSWPGRGTGGEESRPAFLVERLKLLFPSMTPMTQGSGDDGFRLAAPGPALAALGLRPEVREALALVPEYGEKLAGLDRALSHTRGGLSQAAVSALYGRKVNMSASRMDLYRSCQFSYFMQYGLGAKPRQKADFDAAQYGTFVHFVLEQVIKQWDWETPPHARSAALHNAVTAAMEDYSINHLGGLEDKSARFRHLFERLRDTLERVVENAVEELSSGAFRPVAFELGFGAEKDLPPVEITAGDLTISLSGFVDRVDGWEKDGRLYLRVVDYKTGKKSFDLTQLFHGMGLQMLIYLFALERCGQTHFGEEVSPAGVLYFPARDALVAGSRSMTEEERKKLADKALARHGLVLDDPTVLSAMEQSPDGTYRFLPIKVNKDGDFTGDSLVSAQQMGDLSRHLEKTLDEIGKELASGTIAANPYWRGPDANACQWCQYAAACQFEEGRGGDCRRWLTKLDSKSFWQAIEEGT